ncbi:MAG: zinc-dependent metalloprotease [Thermoleophilaceae bacterium]
MVDWTIARQVARFAAGSDSASELGPQLAVLSADAERHVGAYTGLTLSGPAPTPEAVDRATWAEANLDTLAGYLDPVAERLDGRLGAAGPLAGALRTVTSATLAAEAGLVVGYLSQRVLGQFELSLLQPEAPARLLFVAPNLERAVTEMDVDRDAFLAWIAMHEVAHVFQFSGVPWLREHLGGLLRRYLETVDVRIERGAAGALPSMPSIAGLVERFREGGLVALVQTREQRGILSGVQAAMSVVEGYSEHVMDAVGAEVLDSYEGLRDAMERRRSSRSAPERVLWRLLGLDMKMRQYELGRRFCDEVVEAGGLDLLNRVWESPELLPGPRELSQPRTWCERAAAAPAAA